MKKGKQDLSSTKARKFDDSWRYLYAFLIASFLIVFGFLASYAISGFELNNLKESQEDLYYDFYKAKLKSDLFNFTDCSSSLKDMGTTLDFEGAMLSSLEQQFGKDSEKILEGKKYYYLLELSHFEFVKSINKQCEFDANFIFFFYSNSETEVDNAERIGRILTYVKKEKPNTFIYSFDSNSEDSLIKLLKKEYDVESFSTVIINEKIKLESIQNSNDILKYLK
ncbi:MAG: hypothetical protein U9Q99_00810 [Nanoarchaeota archaeon]|nr:hypothetical protein [Nanoarchaeota archaeon]